MSPALNSLTIRLAALLWMFPIFPLVLVLLWVIGVPVCALLGRSILAGMWDLTSTSLPRIYADSWRQFVTGVES